MSQLGQKRRFGDVGGTSAYPSRAAQKRTFGNRRLGPRLCEKSHRQKKRRIVFFVVFSRRQLLALFVFKPDEIETEILNPN
jgi:hypothetical protein